MRKQPITPSLALLLAALPVWLFAAPPQGGPNAAAPASQTTSPERSSERPTREIYVPFKDLEVLLKDQPRRVLLSREEFNKLLEEADVQPDSAAPHKALIVAADYQGEIRDGRAELSGKLVVDVLEEGVHALGLPLSGVGLTAAALDGKAASLGRGPSGQLMLLVEGEGRHELELQAVAPVETTAARQILHFRLPHPPAARLRLTVPGDVELKSGAKLVRREVDEDAVVTQLEMLPPAGDATLELTLNSRQRRQQQAVVARSVAVDEITQAYERLHTTVSLGILHGAVDRFRFAVPEGFEITEVNSPDLARWVVEANDDGGRVLVVELREPTTETVLLNLAAIRTPAVLDGWQLPVVRLLAEGVDVVGEVSVIGLLVEERLQAESIAAEGLVRIDNAVLRSALPESVFHAEPGTPTLRPVVAYYAPQGNFTLNAGFHRPPAGLAVTSSLLLILGDDGQEALGSFALLPAVEKRFGVDFSVPAGWHVRRVADPEDKPLKFERHGPVDKPGRVHVRFSRAIDADEDYPVSFEAVRTPPGWLGGWSKRTEPLPVFRVSEATREEAAVAVAVRGDMRVHLESQQGLVPLDESERAELQLDDVPTALAMRSLGPDYAATLAVERTEPRITARTYSLLKIRPDGLQADYQVDFNVDEARTRHLSLLLPADTTPEKLTVRGLGGVDVKQYHSEVDGPLRRWTAELGEPRRGPIGLAVEFHQPLDEQRREQFDLPIVAAADAQYQSGLVAVEGSAELDTELSSDLTRVDVGEFADARVQPGRRLLGVFSFVGDPTGENAKDAIRIAADVARRPGYALHPAIVERAELDTLLSADGSSQTKGLFRLRTKALYLELELPPGSDLWSAHLDKQPIKPQREDDRLLVSFPAGAEAALRELVVVYSTPVKPVALHGTVSLPAPQLLLHDGGDAATAEVPLADLAWRVRVPSGYEPVRNRGTVATDAIRRPTPALLNVGAALYVLAGGVNPFYGGMQAAREAARRTPSANNFGQVGVGAVGDDDHGGEEAAVGMDQQGAFSADLDIPLSEEEIPAAEDPFAAPPTEEPPLAKPESAAAQPMEAMTEELERGEEADATSPPDSAATPPPPQTPPAPENQPMPTEEPQQAQVDGIAVQSEVGQFEGTALQGRAHGRRVDWLEGTQSLQINPEKTPEYSHRTIALRSLGDNPRLELTLAHRATHNRLAWGLGLAVVICGLGMTTRPLRAKLRLILAAVLVGSLLPLVVDSVEVARLGNALVYAGCLLVPYYLFAAAVRWACRATGKCSEAARGWLERRRAAAVSSTTSVLAFVAIGVAAGDLVAADPPTSKSAPAQGGSAPYVIQIVEPGGPVDVPEDAIILPYDPVSEEGIQGAGQLLVPYARYVELWNRAHPDKKLETPAPPVPYALAGGSYSATLSGEEYLQVVGQLHIDVFADEPVSVPLRLGGGVLSMAELNGRAARLTVVEATQPAANAPAQQRAQVKQAQAPEQQIEQAPNASQEEGPTGGSLLLLHVSGKGRHTLELAVRLRLARQGGWRVADGLLPAAPATALSLAVPDAGTEVRLSNIADRAEHETEQSGEKIETALGPGGAIAVRWRPKVAEGRVDRTLTADSLAVLDVQEDGLRVVWRVRLEFRHGQREEFRLRVPADYTVEKVEGTNRRGWEAGVDGTTQTIDVSLLSGAQTREELTVHLWRRGAVGEGALAEFAVPVLEVPEAALHRGEINIRRSPLMEVWTVDTRGVSRTDLSSEVEPLAGGADSEESPLGIKPLAAYRFVTTPYTIRLGARPLESEVTAQLQSVLKLAEYQRKLESRVVLTVRGRPLHRVEVFLPEGFSHEHVTAPGAFEWGTTDVGGRQLLSVHLAAGQLGEVPILLRGRLGLPGRVDRLAVPRLEVRGVERQRGEMAVQIDPALKVEAEALRNCEPVALIGQVYDWLSPELRPLAKLALRTTGGDYSGRLAIGDRRTVVHATTLTNVRITDRVVEETILLTFDVEEAGVRRLQFQLPARLAEARISAPLLRHKTVEPLDGDAERVQVTLELQDDVRGGIRVLVENDRSADPARLAAAPDVPIPIVDTGRTDRRLVTLEMAARHRLIDVEPKELTPLSPELKEWQALRNTLGHDIQQAFLVESGAKEPRLVLTGRSRPTVETSGARIGLSKTELVMDANGAYRGAVKLKVDNTTEQYLEIELPQGARLWSAVVDGEPVKPSKPPGAKGLELVRIPILKTQPGDLDYDVVLVYGGKRPRLSGLSRVDFPLVRSRNIKVERSAVELYVPKTHDWLRFAGTMGPPAERADLAALQGAYYEQEAESLLGQAREAIRQKKAFASVRALSNLKRQVAVMQDYSESMRGHSSNENLDAQLAGNAAVVDEVQQELKRLEDSPPATDEFDNRGRLNELYVEQTITRSRNVVQDLGGNWADESVQGPAGQQQQGGRQQPGGEQGELVFFNGRWLDKNKLLNTFTDDAKEDAGRAPGDRPGKPTAGKGLKLNWKGDKAPQAPVKPPAQPQTAGFAQSKLKAELGGQLAEQMAIGDERRQRERKPASSVERYQQQLAEQDMSRGSGIRAGGEYGYRLEVPRGPQSGVDADQSQGLVGSVQLTDAGEADFGPGFGGGQPGGEAAVEALASLDVQLPQRDEGTYHVYRFATPLGDTRIVAHAVRGRLSLALMWTAALVVLAALSWLVVRAARRGRFQWLAHPSGTWLMIALGLFCLLLGLFPVAALAVLVTAIALKTRGYLHRKVAAGSHAEA